MKRALLILFVIGILLHLSFFVYRISRQVISQGVSTQLDASSSLVPDSFLRRTVAQSFSVPFAPSNTDSSNRQQFSQRRSCKCASLDECNCCRSNAHPSLAGDVCLNASFNHHYQGVDVGFQVNGSVIANHLHFQESLRTACFDWSCPHGIKRVCVEARNLSTKTHGSAGCFLVAVVSPLQDRTEHFLEFGCFRQMFVWA